MKETTIWIIIPAYNEEHAIKSVLTDLEHHGYHNILVINDASTDRTVHKAQKQGTEVLSHLINRGYGAALWTGIRYVAKKYSPDILVTFDGDGQHTASDIQALTKPIQEDRADIVLGSRFLEPTSHIPLFRHLVLRCGIIFTNIISHMRLTDTHNGLRAMNRKAYTSIHIHHRGMESSSDIIDEIPKNNLRHSECPVHIRYSSYSLGKGQRTENFLKIGLKILFHKLSQ